MPVGDDWRRYPFELVPGDPHFVFPAAEANHPTCESDTWFLAGELTGEADRKFAFSDHLQQEPARAGDRRRLLHARALRPRQRHVRHLHRLRHAVDEQEERRGGEAHGGRRALGHDVRQPCRHRGLAYLSGQAGDLLPYTYDVTFCGTDQHGDDMRLDLHVTPTRAPVPLGAAAYNGTIECFGQATTYSYFQTGMTMAGTLSWGSIQEKVKGTAGHVDRQWFPLVANDGGGTGDIRARAHEWRTINLDNDVDLSIWRQFDRTNGNALQPFSGATTSSPDADPEYADDIEVTVTSYVRWPDSIRTLVPPPAKARYMPDRHRLTSQKLDLDLTGEPLVPAPAHGLPLEYMEGPYRYRGTFRGEPVSGFAFYERSLALYRDWELAAVLEAAESSEGLQRADR